MRLPLTQWPRFDLRLRDLKAVNTVNLGVNPMHWGQFDAALTSLRQDQTMAQAEKVEGIASECLVRIAEISALQSDPKRAHDNALFPELRKRQFSEFTLGHVVKKMPEHSLYSGIF